MRPAAAIALLLACVAAPAAAQPADPSEALWRSFVDPPAEARPMVRWWWFGPAVEEQELDREIRAMKAGGFGGFEVQPTYPLLPDGGLPGLRNLPYLSDDFIAALRHAAGTARREGMRVDVTIGSGWPFGGAHIPIDQAAAHVRMERRPVPAGATELMLPRAGPGETLLSAAIGPARRGAVDRPLTALPIDRPRIALEASSEAREALVFVAGRTGQQVKRPALGAEGFVLDHLDPRAVANHIEAVGERLLSAFKGGPPPDAMFSDSLEAYGSSWTGDLPAEFRKRRGYDLLAHLPALFLDTPDSAAVRFDWARTLSELVDERYLTPFDAWAKARGTKFRAQVYGIPPATLSSNARVALPEGEGADWRRFTSTRWATSAAHLYGRSVVSSEVWTWLHSPSWAATPLDMKIEADKHFLQGVTQLIGHGWPYAPPAAADPGWAFYAAAALSDRNPWYAAMPEVTRYLQRVSHVLRLGEPANAVAIYLPTEDAFAGMKPDRASVNEWMATHLPARLVPQILDAGHGFDFIDAQAVTKGFTHRVLLLPKMTRIDPAAYRAMAGWVQRGGKVVAIGGWPSAAGGLLDGRKASAEVAGLSKKIAALPGVTVTDADGVGAAVTAAAAPDVRLAVPNPAIGFVHRRLPEGELYFVANTGNLPVETSARFAGDRGNGAWWDPVRETREPAGTGDIAISLAPYESRVLLFAGPARPAMAAPAPEEIDISTGWTLEIAGRPERPLRKLGLWADDPELRYFSGTGIYRRTLRIGREKCVAIDFGPSATAAAPGTHNHGAALAAPVRDVAVVFVNGKRAGSVWAPPYRLDLSGALRPGANRIEVRVSNTAVNLLAGRPLEDYRLLSARYGERFQAQDLDRIVPAPSGLTGPIKLVVASRCG